MIYLTRKLEYTKTQNEAEALLLEANLIKKLKPRYNILLRDDKSFPYVKLSMSHPYPRISKFRGAQTDKDRYFGPFASVGAVNHTLAILQRVFLLRPCSDNIFKNRTRPCLQYQIKRCSAPCVDKISQPEYDALISQAVAFLSGKSQDVQKQLNKDMQQASDAMDYEMAAEIRDRIRALNTIQKEQRIQTGSLGDADIIALYREGKQVCIKVFFVRGSQHFGSSAFFPARAEDSDDADVLQAFIGQFYQRNQPPKLLLLSQDIEDVRVIESALSQRAEHKVELLIPKRGEKRQIIKQAISNAHQSLIEHQASHKTQRKHLEAVQILFGLESMPERIEVYDNSHIQGEHAIGGMIVAGVDGFMKQAYRKFTIKRPQQTQTGGDDYAMMREVLTRRFKRLQKEDPDRTQEQWPDVLLIDGGAGHLTTITEILEEMGVHDIPYVCIAKGRDRNAGREQFFQKDKDMFQLPVDDPTLHFLQRLRDEAHRFAIGTHRQKRSKTMTVSELDHIEGIGTSRKRLLMNHFGSSKAVGQASLAELEQVSGLSKALAAKIFRFFNK
jgi:excinuclease ABC subunit C